MDDDERKLLEKLKKIEALRAGATTDGERSTAETVADIIRKRLAELQTESPPTEFKLTFGDDYSRRVFVALCRRYELKPYRYKGQRYTTINVKVSSAFMDQTLWPTFMALDAALKDHLNMVTARIVKQAIHPDASDADEAKQLQG